jgi:tRNA (guanine-N7-)-methyltransferase
MRVRQHVNPLGVFFEEFRGRLPVLVPGREIEVEIGCAEAQFLFERAAIDPGRDYVGIDVRDQLVDWVNKQAALRSAPVQAVFCNANLHLPRLFAAGSVARVYLNFPDPWFKKHQRNRRMIDDVLARAIHGVCRPGAEIFVQSDVWEVALDAMEIFERADEQFANAAGPWSFWRHGNPYGARSWRETNAAAEGLPIWRMRYVRLPDAAAEAVGAASAGASGPSTRSWIDSSSRA